MQLPRKLPKVVLLERKRAVLVQVPVLVAMEPVISVSVVVPMGFLEWQVSVERVVVVYLVPLPSVVPRLPRLPAVSVQKIVERVNHSQQRLDRVQAFPRQHSKYIETYINMKFAFFTLI
jgi:hypothetical protein